MNEKIIESFVVTVCSPRYYVENDTICEGDSLFWQGNYYCASGTYNALYKTALSCDSIYELKLYIRPSLNIDLSAPSDVCFNETAIIEVNGNVSADMVFNWDFDQGSIISGADEGPYEISWSSLGLKTVTFSVTIDGCTSTVSSNIVCSSVSGGLSKDFAGEPILEDVKLWPNPADEVLYLTTGIHFPLVELSVWSVDGVQQMIKPKGECTSEIDISALNSGVYVIRLIYDGGTKSLKVVKR